MDNLVKLEFNNKEGYFYIEEDGKIDAKMTFVCDGEDRIIIEHTEVNSENNGKGYGKMMVEKAVAFAREKNIKITPVCSFVKNIFDNTAQYNDVI